MKFYKNGRETGGFESGHPDGAPGHPRQPALHLPPRGSARHGAGRAAVPINDFDLASRLSFFLWGSGPDEELIAAATRGALGTPAGLEQQTRRMLADPRASALSTRFASQWLRLQDLDKIHPDARLYPQFDYDARATRCAAKPSCSSIASSARIAASWIC